MRDAYRPGSVFRLRSDCSEVASEIYQTALDAEFPSQVGQTVRGVFLYDAAKINLHALG